MNKFAKEIILMNIEKEMKNSYLDYAMSVIVGRALPDVRDGLKPVHRRILFTMYKLKNSWDKSYKKSARIVGDVIGKYHPHGDLAVYETIVRMAQSFSLRYMLIDGQGNFGSLDGDSAAAMRYTEIRMSRIAHELLLDLDKDTVDFIPNYDESEIIPSILPAKIPNLLINGSSGIAVGMATNIPPHNLKEIINGCLAYIKDKNISVEKLMTYIPGPDFPTFGAIIGYKGIREAYLTGKGKIKIRAKANIIKDQNNNKDIIVISEIPYQVNKSKLIEKIAELVKNKRIEGINNLRDESDKDGIRIIIEIKKDNIAEIILNNLYSLSQLQISFGINMVALDQGKPKLMSLKNILKAFIEHRKEIILRRTKFKLNKAYNRIHILEALLIALLNIDLIINIIKKSSNLNEAKIILKQNRWEINSYINIFKKNNISKDTILSLDYYVLTKIQVNAILDLRINMLTKLEKNKLIKEYQVHLSDIYNFKQILNNSNTLKEVICNELNLIKKIYKDNRRTKIIYKHCSINQEDLIIKEDVVVTLSYYGYVKYQPINEYEAQKRGGKGKSAVYIKKEDFIDSVLVVNTHDTILLFSNRGLMYKMKVYQLPKSTRGSRGKPIINLLPLVENERITAIMPVNKYKLGCNIFMVTSSGIVKKTDFNEFSKNRITGLNAINLNDGDELIGVNLTNGSNEVMLFSSHGKVVRFPENQVRSVGRSATGVKGINLSSGDKVVSLIVPKKNKKILIVTSHGYGKRTIQEEYPTKSRANKGVISIKINNRNGYVVGAIQVNNFDQIIMITNAGTMVRIRVSEISIISRNTQGVRLIRTNNNEKVVGLQRLLDSYN